MPEPIHDTSDPDVIERVRRGETAAFAVIIDRYKDPLVGYLIRLLGKRERTEDVAQETLEVRLDRPERLGVFEPLGKSRLELRQRITELEERLRKLERELDKLSSD